MTLKDYTDALIAKGSMPSGANHYTLLKEDTDALSLGIFGDRAGGVAPHNHSSRGARILTRPIAAVALGPYARPGSGLGATLGLPVYPPSAGVDYAAVTFPAGKNYKLLVHAGIYLPGGITAVRVRAGVRFTGAGVRDFTLAFVLRSSSKIGYHYFGVGNYSIGQSSSLNTNGANDFIDTNIQLAPLSRIGDIAHARWAELLIVLISNPTAATTARLLGFKVDPVPTADQPPPLATGNPPVSIDVREYQIGSPLLEGLFKRAAMMFDGLILATLGRIPGKVLEWGSPVPVEDKALRYRVDVLERNGGKGIHQHTGARYFDGALIPGQVGLICPVDDMGDTATSDSNASPVQGAFIDPTSSGSASPTALRMFRLRVSVARGDTKLILKLALAPGTATAEGYLWIFCRSRMIVAADYNAPVYSINLADAYPTSFSTDIITSIEIGQQPPASSKAAGNYWQLQVTPEDCDICTLNSVRAAVGLKGHWTNAAIAPLAQQPDNSLVATSGMNDSYRVSKDITLNLDPQGRTGDVMFEFSMYLLNAAGVAQPTGRLQWLALARPEEA